MKKKFKETFVGKALKTFAEGALDVLPIPDIRTYFAKDKDGNGIISYKEVDYLKLGGAVAVLATLLKLDIVDFNQVIELIKALIVG